MKKHLLIIASLFIFANFANAQTGGKYAEDEKAIRQIVTNLTDAWAAGDGAKWADQFTDDVDYTVWNGLYSSGREENRKGHQMIFDTFYKNTKLNIEIRKIRFLRDDVAIVHMFASVIKKDEKPQNDSPETSPMMVLSRENGKWRIVAFQNTPVFKEGDEIVNRKGKKN